MLRGKMVRFCWVMMTVGLGFFGSAGQALAATAPAGTYENVVGTTDIEKATGLKGVKAVPRDPSKGATGMLNFADAQGAVVFSATFEIITPEALVKTKASPSWKGLIKGPVSGVGDEAYSGPKSGDPFILIFKKGKNWVTVSSGMNPANMKAKIPMEKMKNIAKVMISRL